MSFARNLISVGLGVALFDVFPNLPLRSGEDHADASITTDTTLKKQPILSYGLAVNIYKAFVADPSEECLEIERTENLPEDPITHANTSIDIRISDKEQIGLLAHDNGDGIIETNEVVFLAQYYATQGSVVQTSVFKTGRNASTQDDVFTASRLFAINKHPLVRLNMNEYDKPYDWTPHNDKQAWPKKVDCLLGIFKRKGCDKPRIT